MRTAQMGSVFVYEEIMADSRVERDSANRIGASHVIMDSRVSCAS